MRPPDEWSPLVFGVGPGAGTEFGLQVGSAAGGNFPAEILKIIFTFLFRVRERRIMSKYAFLRSNASLVIVCLLLGLIGGFKIANSQYRAQQGAALNRDIAQVNSNMNGSQEQIGAIIDKDEASPNNAELNDEEG